MNEVSRTQRHTATAFPAASGIAQILLVRYVYEHDSTVLYMLPLLFLSALVGGIIVGWISLRLLMALKEIRA